MITLWLFFNLEIKSYSSYQFLYINIVILLFFWSKIPKIYMCIRMYISMRSCVSFPQWFSVDVLKYGDWKPIGESVKNAGDVMSFTIHGCVYMHARACVCLWTDPLNCFISIIAYLQKLSWNISGFSTYYFLCSYQCSFGVSTFVICACIVACVWVHVWVRACTLISVNTVYYCLVWAALWIRYDIVWVWLMKLTEFWVFLFLRNPAYNPFISVWNRWLYWICFKPLKTCR